MLFRIQRRYLKCLYAVCVLALAVPIARAEPNTGPRSFSGVFHGEIFSSNQAVPSVTTLNFLPDGHLAGTYSFGKPPEEAISGSLRECDVSMLTVTCRWQDVYGTGLVRMHFTPDFCSFNGEWSDQSAPDTWAFWNGIRDCGKTAAISSDRPLL